MPIRQDHLVIHEVDDDLLLYDPRVDRSHRLNVTAAAIFRACDGRTSPREIAGRLQELFEIDLTEALADTREMLEQMVRENLVAESPAAIQGGA